MKRHAPLALTAAALVLAAGSLPACAQRGGSGGPRGGFSGHSASSFHGGFASAPHYNFSGVRAFNSARPAALPALRAGSPAYRPRPVSGGHPTFRGRPYSFAGYSGGIPYFIPDWGYSDFAGYPDTGDDSGAPPNYIAQDEGPLPPQPDDAPPPPSESDATPQPAPPQPAAADEDAITLIFKDGRPPLQIHNYALTRTTLYVRDQHHRDIPVDQLDLAATEQANRNAGVDFQLPVLPQ